MKGRFIVVGGRPFTMYTGTTTYTAIRVVGTTDDSDDAKALAEKVYDECGGLLLIVDADTGEGI